MKLLVTMLGLHLVVFACLCILEGEDAIDACCSLIYWFKLPDVVYADMTELGVKKTESVTAKDHIDQ